MKQLLTMLAVVFYSINSIAQTPATISGTIINGSSQQPYSGATITLKNAADSSQLKQTITDKNGNYLFGRIPQGNFVISASATGFQSVASKPLMVTATKPFGQVEGLTLVPVNKQLKEVVVTTQKAFIERKIDKTVVNVDASVTNAGSTAMEVLEKSPGITVDKDGNISLKGKAGVMVMLDGKPSYLSATELANLLKSMSATNLDQIEIMTNPSAKYDAAGNSGIINIKTKKNKLKGFNGNITLGYGQGVYAKSNNSLNLNYRNGKFNLFSTFSVNKNNRYQQLNINRLYKNTNQETVAIFTQEARMIRKGSNNSAKFGADYYASKKTTLGVVFTGFYNTQNHSGLTTSYLKNSINVVDSIAVATTAENGIWKNKGLNLNLRHQFDSAGREFSMDADFVNYHTTNNQPFANTVYLPNGTVSNSNRLIGNLPSDINIYSAKADYTHPLKNGIKLETGIKTSFVNTDNTAGYFNIINDLKVPDYEKTNRFRYKENINAGYLNASKEIKKWGFQLGLRLENTNYSGKQFGNPQRRDSAFSRSYVGFFPTSFISFKANAKNQFSFSYGRRINRPAYEDLNPFMFYLDKYTYGEGNPFLRPSYANVLEAAHTYNDWLTTTVNFSHTKDLFSDIFEPRGFATIIKQGNFASVTNASISVNVQKKLTNIYTAIIYTELNYNQYKGLQFSNSASTHGSNFIININNQFKFTKGWSAELSGFYRTKGLEGQISIDPLSQVNAGVQKEILKKQATVKLNIRDAFFTMVQNGRINILNTDASFHQYGDSRVVTLNFTYRFGKQFKAAPKRKTGGAGEEQNRVKGGN